MLEDSDSDEGVTLVRANSGPKLYDVVPFDKIFTFKVVDISKNKDRFEYLLQEGRKLPHQTTVNGKWQFLFGKDLDVQMVDKVNWRKEISPKFTVFTQTGVEVPAEATTEKLFDVNIDMTNINSQAGSSSSTINQSGDDIPVVTMSPEEIVKIGQLLKIDEDNSVVCLICGHKDPDIESLTGHVISHEGWFEFNVEDPNKEKTLPSSSSATSSGSAAQGTG